MVRIPSLSRRTGASSTPTPAPAPTRDENRDGRIDERDTRSFPPVTNTALGADRASDRATYRSASAESATVTKPETDRPRTDRPTVDDRPTGVEPADREPAPVAPAGPRPRASVLATFGLVTGVAAALLVLSGTLAGYGIALGVLASLAAIAGISATARRHVAGKSDALLGLAFGLGAVIVGILAMTGQFAWPTTDGETIQRFREWLDAQFVDRF